MFFNLQMGNSAHWIKTVPSKNKAMPSQKKISISAIADSVGGKATGNPETMITGVSTPESAKPGDIVFISKKKFLPRLEGSHASAVLVDCEYDIDLQQIVTTNPGLAFAELVNEFHPLKKPAPGISPKADVGKNVQLGKDVSISAFASIGDHSILEDGVVVMSGATIREHCRIGRGSVLHPNVTLYPETQIGADVILHAGVVIGADGFGYTLDKSGQHYKINQIGKVVIEDRVEVGANSCIDRAGLGVTVVKAGTKIDNLVQIAHNCEVGENSILVAQSGLAGSCKLGRYTVIAGQSGLVDHITLGDQVTVAAKTAVTKNFPSGSVVSGFPAATAAIWRKYVAVFPKLPNMVRKIRELESRLNKVENKNDPK